MSKIDNWNEENIENVRDSISEQDYEPSFRPVEPGYNGHSQLDITDESRMVVEQAMLR